MMVILVSVLSFGFFLLFQSTGIYAGDSGDLVTAAYLGGVPHPPGYPLYTGLGWLVSHLPLLTVAWRVTLLSSFPHAIVVGLIYLLCWELTGKKLASFFAAVALAGNYLFALYSVTPEVFALFDLFVVSLVYVLVRWERTKNSTYLLWGSFLFGLALTHHHVVLFLVPAGLYWLWAGRNLLATTVTHRWSFIARCVGAALSGLIPYAYVFIAARHDPIINWDRAVTLPSFIRLLTRADYGTFLSNGFFGQSLRARVLQLQAYGQFLVLDLTIIGIILAVLGLFWLWQQQRSYSLFFLLAIGVLGPGFFFYASFPLLNRFTLGTYERFLLPSYVLLAALIGLGFSYAQILFGGLTKRFRTRSVRTLAQVGFSAVLLLYPTSIAAMTSWRLWGLPADRTAQHLGEDILSSVPPNSILLMGRDTPLFIVQYVRYVQGVRPDVRVFHLSRLPLPDYQATIRHLYPDVVIPTTKPESFLASFVKENSKHTPVVGNTTPALGADWYWVPRGLVYLATTDTDIPSVETFMRTNNDLWASYHDPASGILARYNHLMVSDVRDVYAQSRLELGKILLKANKIPAAQAQFDAAVVLGGDIQLSDAYKYRGITKSLAKDCPGALADLQQARTVAGQPEKELIAYEAVVYRDCVGDTTKAAQLFAQYEQTRRSAEIPLTQ